MGKTDMSIAYNPLKFETNLRPFAITRRMVRNYYNDECELAIVSGMPEGIGKSGYVNKALADVHGFLNCHQKELVECMYQKPEEHWNKEKWKLDYPAMKPFLKYLPEDVVDMCLRMIDAGKRTFAFHWDDGGTWLNAMEFHDPFVIAFMEYAGLARTNWAMIIITTAVQDWVLKKLRVAEGILRVKIIKLQETDNPYKPRMAKAYRIMKFPGRQRVYWRGEWRDYFSPIMPDSFYKWYKPTRDHFAKLATHRMAEALKKRKIKGWHRQTARDEVVLKEMEGHIQEANEVAPELSAAVANALEVSSREHP